MGMKLLLKVRTWWAAGIRRSGAKKAGEQTGIVVLKQGVL
jgi:hypothetical protein